MNCFYKELRLTKCFHSKCPFKEGYTCSQTVTVQDRILDVDEDPMQNFFNYLRKLLLFQEKIIFLANMI